jgi:hypothetical protein
MLIFSKFTTPPPFFLVFQTQSPTGGYNRTGKPPLEKKTLPRLCPISPKTLQHSIINLPCQKTHVWAVTWTRLPGSPYQIDQ